MASRKRKKAKFAAPAPTIDELLVSRERMNRASVEFLKVDLQTALTFVGIARQASDEFRRKRARAVARKAYETLSMFVNRVDLTGENERQVRLGLKQLKAELESLGEVI